MGRLRRQSGQPDVLQDGSRIGGLDPGVRLLGVGAEESAADEEAIDLDDMEPDQAKQYLKGLSAGELAELAVRDIVAGSQNDDYEEATYLQARGAALGTLALMRHHGVPMESSEDQSS